MHFCITSRVSCSTGSYTTGVIGDGCSFIVFLLLCLPSGEPIRPPSTLFEPSVCSCFPSCFDVSIEDGWVVSADVPQQHLPTHLHSLLRLQQGQVIVLHIHRPHPAQHVLILRQHRFIHMPTQQPDSSAAGGALGSGCVDPARFDALPDPWRFLCPSVAITERAA